MERKRQYDSHCSVMAQELVVSLSSWRADVAVAVGDFNLDVSDIDEMAYRRALPLKAHVVRQTCLVFRDTNQRTTRDGMVQRTARCELALAQSSTPISSDITTDPTPELHGSVVDLTDL